MLEREHSIHVNHFRWLLDGFDVLYGAAESRAFLARIDEAVPAGLEMHMVCDNWTKTADEILNSLAKY